MSEFQQLAPTSSWLQNAQWIDSSSEDESQTPETFLSNCRRLRLVDGLNDAHCFRHAVTELRELIKAAVELPDLNQLKALRSLLSSYVKTAVELWNNDREADGKALQTLMYVTERYVPRKTYQAIIREYKQKSMYFKRQEKKQKEDNGDESDWTLSCLPEECFDVLMTKCDPATLINLAACNKWMYRRITYATTIWKRLCLVAGSEYSRLGREPGQRPFRHFQESFVLNPPPFNIFKYPRVCTREGCLWVPNEVLIKLIEEVCEWCMIDTSYNLEKHLEGLGAEARGQRIPIRTLYSSDLFCTSELTAEFKGI